MYKSRLSDENTIKTHKGIDEVEDMGLWHILLIR